MKILVTGATGYVGHNLAKKLAERGDQVHVLVRNTASANIPVHENIRVFAGDITDRQSINAAIRGCEQVYHTAALVKIFAKERSLFEKVNVEGTKNVLSEALENGVEKFLFTSSCGVIGPSLGTPMSENDPRIVSFDNDYEFTKFLAENVVKEFAQKGLFSVIVALSKVYGPGIETHPFSVNTVINKFIKGMPALIPRPGELATNYCYINDVVEGHLLAMSNGTSGEKYILGGENISYTDLFQKIRSLSGTKARIIQTPQFFVQVWGAMQWVQFKLTNKEPFVTNKSIRTIFCNKTFTSEKAIQHLGYRLTPIEEGLQQTIQFLKNNHHA
ncbi:MAG: SDR family NAD(P)-dependent oxidoreductase [Chitinophagaceae bacterium]|nr:SDR family NAD(P)-dependent oxidoreductase [Chitinophagaceae bacterium]